MTQLDWLKQLLDQGFHRMGQLEIISAPHAGYWLCHEDDREAVLQSAGEPATFLITHDPYQALEIPTYSGEIAYRFTK